MKFGIFLRVQSPFKTSVSGIWHKEWTPTLFSPYNNKKNLENFTGQILSLCNWPFWISLPRAKPICSKSVSGFTLACPALFRHSFLNSASWLFTHCSYFCPLSLKTALSDSQGPGMFLGVSCMPELRAALYAKLDKQSSVCSFPTMENLLLDDTIPSSPRFTHH